MEKENVLELEITVLNDEYSLVKVTKLNDEVIKKGKEYSFGYANSSTLLMNSALRTAPSFSSFFLILSNVLTYIFMVKMIVLLLKIHL